MSEATGLLQAKFAEPQAPPPRLNPQWMPHPSRLLLKLYTQLHKKGLSPKAIRYALIEAAYKLGLNDSHIAKETGIPDQTVRDYRLHASRQLRSNQVGATEAATGYKGCDNYTLRKLLTKYFDAKSDKELASFMQIDYRCIPRILNAAGLPPLDARTDSKYAAAIQWLRDQSTYFRQKGL